MGARTGQQYLDRLRTASATVQIEGETLTGGIADHPAFRNVARSYAELYDMQHDPALRDLMTHPGGPGEDPYGTSFLVPRTVDDLVKRRLASKQWADHSLGTLGRTGDYVNACLMAMSGATACGWIAGRWLACRIRSRTGRSIRACRP